MQFSSRSYIIDSSFSEKWKYQFLKFITGIRELFTEQGVIRGRKRHVCVSVPKECVSVYRTEGVYCRFIQYGRISIFEQSRRVHLFIVNCLLKNKFNMHVVYYLHI